MNASSCIANNRDTYYVAEAIIIIIIIIIIIRQFIRRRNMSESLQGRLITMSITMSSNFPTHNLLVTENFGLEVVIRVS